MTNIRILYMQKCSGYILYLINSDICICDLATCIKVTPRSHPEVTLCCCHTPPTSFVCYNSSINTEVLNVLNISLSEGGRIHHNRTGPRVLHWKMPAVSGWLWTPHTWKIHHQFLPTNHMHYQNKVMKLPSQIPPSFSLRVQRNQI